MGRSVVIASSSFRAAIRLASAERSIPFLHLNAAVHRVFLMSNNASSSQLADAPRRYRTMNLRWFGWCVVLILITGIVLAMQVDWTSATGLYKEAKLALERRDYDESLRLGQRMRFRASHRAEGMLVAAEATAKLGRFDDALRLLEKVGTEKAALSEIALLLTARIQCDDLHRPADAERTLQEALSVNPTSLSVHEK
jgi:tetratricopeptide (TPR) repeat protein